MHNIFIVFFPCAALLISKPQDAIVANPTDTILFRSAKWEETKRLTQFIYFLKKGGRNGVAMDQFIQEASFNM